MAIIVEPQVDHSTIWQVTEEILEALKNDPVLNEYYESKYMHLDWWWEQPFFESDEYALPPLCYYISAEVTDISNEGDNRDRLRVSFTIYMEWRSNADTHVGAVNKNNFLLFAPWYNAMHRCLAGLKTENMYTALRRVAGPASMGELARKGVLISTTYSCLIYDHTASPEKIKAHIHELNVGGEIILPG